MAQPQPRIETDSRVQWVGPVNDLRIDHRAQRQLRPGWVAKRLPEFDINGLGIIVVNRRLDGQLYIIDGQHRCAFLREIGWGDQKIEAEVFNHLPLEAEAKEFLRRNDRQAMGAYDLFRASLTAKEDDAVAIEAIVSGHGLRVDNQARRGSITAVSSLRQVYTAQEGPRALSDALTLLKAAWGDDYSSFEANLLRGAGMVTGRYPGEDLIVRLAKKLAGYPGGAPGVKGAAQTLRRIRSQSVPTCVANVMIDLHNKGRGRKLEGF